MAADISHLRRLLKLAAYELTQAESRRLAGDSPVADQWLHCLAATVEELRLCLAGTPPHPSRVWVDSEGG